MKIRYFAHAPKVFILWVKLFPETILLIDARESQAAIDAHHASPMMKTIAKLRDKYDLKMTVERYTPDNTMPKTDEKFIRK